MLSMTCDDEAGFMEVVVDGAITRTDYEAVVTAVDQLLTRHSKLDFVEVVRRLGPMPPEVWWRDLVFHLHHRDFLRRAAIVSDSGWVGPLIRLLAPLYPAELRYFPESALDDARRWAQGGTDAG
ncbi:SpoIIAA family protein [Sandarakinorhabdus oryzae]|uniref:STAS/SEC14 domain-containing protein n=1 Tax=Sandarakinorhabdus oryzae TaxID=2675220 RepID=UPI0012E25C2B|nr:STAS/SEC14 domain-containing protein [Sandarakinorhabdus oryzae]